MKNTNPNYSVIIPTYNRIKLLPRAIHSVLNQTFENFELLIVDDASTDDIKSVADSFTDERIHYIRRQVNGGAAAARNSGILLARGRLISFLDDDDEYLPQFLSEMNRYFEAAPESVGLGWCGIRTVTEKPKGKLIVSDGTWQPSFDNKEQAYLSILKSRRVGTSSGLTVRKSCFEIVGLFDETMQKAEDTDFLIRIVRQFEFLVVPTILIKHYIHSGSRLTVYDRHMAEAYERILQKNLTTLRLYPDLWAALHYKTGWLHYHSGNKVRARQYMRQVFHKKPFHLKTWLSVLLFEVLRTQAPLLHQKISLVMKQLRSLLNQ